MALSPFQFLKLSLPVDVHFSLTFLRHDKSSVGARVWWQHRHHVLPSQRVWQRSICSGSGWSHCCHLWSARRWVQAGKWLMMIQTDDFIHCVDLAYNILHTLLYLSISRAKKWYWEDLSCWKSKTGAASDFKQKLLIVELHFQVEKY